MRSKLIIVFVIAALLTLSSCSRAGYTEADRKKDLKTKDERIFIDAASEKFRLAIEKEIVTGYDSSFPEVYPEGYCGYVVDNDTNTITVILLDTSKSEIARYSGIIPDKYQKYLRFDEGKHSLNELSKAFYEIQTLLVDEGISFGWNFDGNASTVKVSASTDKKCSLTTTEEVEKRVKDLLEQYHFEVQYEYDIHLNG